MCVALIGGIDRLEKHYLEEAGRLGMELKIFNKNEGEIGRKLRNVDAMVVFTNKVSHNAKARAVKEARSRNIPVYMHHSCGVCTLRDCLNCFRIINNGGAKPAAMGAGQ